MLLSLTASALGPGEGGSQGDELGASTSTVEALTSNVTLPSPPAALLSPPGHDAQNLPRSGTGSAEVSRSMPRAEFRTDDGGTVECSGAVPDIGTNGHVPDESMCDLWQAPYRDRADAVVTLTKLNDAYTAKFGRPMCLTSAYRTLEEQAALRRSSPGLAAPVGQSNHGWGLAVDFCRETYTGTAGAWLRANAAAYAWDNPSWARRGGSGPYEPWHWEYVPGVKALVAAGLEK
ncbi:MAG TPA: M15 family metallopeptidase [Propionicimonas sp.]